MELFLLAVLLVGCLFIIPLGLPGTWLMVGAAIGYGALVPEAEIGWPTMAGTALLALLGEIAEFLLAGRYARRYGGSRRAEWGAILGGIVGAIVGIPVPIVGPVLGAFAGSFGGALVMELTRGSTTAASTRVAWGALVGRAVAAALKVALGIVIAVWILIAA